MKRILLVMLSLGLVLAFSASAMAVDVKFSGSFYAAGMYQDRTSLVSIDNTASTGVNTSTAFYYQRLRVQTDFIASPGLKLVTRFDAMERIWGGIRGEENPAWNSSTGGASGQGPAPGSAGTRTENQNIAFDWAYVSYTSPIGLIEVGYQADNGWGTVFGNNAINGASVGKINYLLPVGPVYISATVSKPYDNNSSAIAASGRTDVDRDNWSLAAIWAANKDIQLGLLGSFQHIATGRPAAMQQPYLLPFAYNAKVYGINPYAKAKFGKVAVEAEFLYVFGKVSLEDGATRANAPYSTPVNEIAVRNMSAYLNVLADFDKVYGGFTFAYISGDDNQNGLEVVEGGFVDGGVDFTPTLIMFNSERTYWAGDLKGWNYTYSGALLGSTGPTPNASVMSNAWFAQGNIGFRPMAALDIKASVAYAVADKPVDMMQNKYGWEFDLTGTYKITNNLSYMLGAGYWWVGDYYKGTTDYNRDLSNNYLLINKLTLTF